MTGQRERAEPLSESLTEHLVTFDEPSLTTLLSRRPDALRGAEPRDLAELGELLNHPASLYVVLSRLTRPCLQLAEAAAALGTGATRARLLSFLDNTGCSERGQDADVDDVLSELYAVAVAWPGARDRIGMPDALASMFGSPLRLGQPLGQLLLTLTVEEMRGVQRVLGLRAGSNKAEAEASLLYHLGQPDIVRAIVAKAPPAVRTELVRMAAGGDPFMGDDPFMGADVDDEDLDYDDDSYVGFSIGSMASVTYDPNRGSIYLEARQWAAERGIMIGNAWSYGWTMPAEVALALRGPAYRAPFTAEAPATITNEVGSDAVESESGVAATAFADHTLAILDRVHRSPLTSLKSGGVGARELTRLAKTVACSAAEARLSLELAHASGLLETRTAGVGSSEQFDAWRTQDPGFRFAVLLAAWWRMERTPLEARDHEDKSIPALSPKPDCAGCREVRVALLQELWRVSPGLTANQAGVVADQGSLTADQVSIAADRASLAAVMLWRRPLLHGFAQDDDIPFATLWQEAGLLGVLSHNAISRLGRVLLDGDEHAIEAQAAALLPQSSDHATFGTDLTAMVVGAPSAQVSSLLDSCADREGRGGATMWRLSPASVRRALDDGITGPELEQSLASVATAELPQPLGYLIADVARRHGLLRVSPAVSMIGSQDTALLAEVCVDRKLKSLGLRLLAPTILACQVPVDVALAAIRTAGYFPMPDQSLPHQSLPDHGDGAARTRANGIPGEFAAKPRSAASELAGRSATRLWGNSRPRTALAPPDPATVAARLVGKPQRSLRVAPSGTEAQLGHLNRRLPGSEVRQLAHAIDHGQPTVIDYAATTGGRTIREISDIQLIGASLYARCALRQDDRVFTVSRIQSVSPAR